MLAFCKLFNIFLLFTAFFPRCCFCDTSGGGEACVWVAGVAETVVILRFFEVRFEEEVTVESPFEVGFGELEKGLEDFPRLGETRFFTLEFLKLGACRLESIALAGLGNLAD